MKKLLLLLLGVLCSASMAWADASALSVGQFIKLHHAPTNASWYIGTNSLGNPWTKYSTAPSDASDIWQLKATDTEGQFYLYHLYTQKYLGKTDAVGDNQNIPLVAETNNAGQYKFIPFSGTISGREYDAFYVRNVLHNSNDRNGLHSTGAVSLVRWASQNDCENSLWLPEVVNMTEDEINNILLTNYTSTRTEFLGKCAGHTDNAGQLGYITTEAKALYDEYKDNVPTTYNAEKYLALKSAATNNIAVLPTLNSWYYVSGLHATDYNRYLVIAENGSLSLQNEKASNSLWKVISVNQDEGTIQLRSAYNPAKYLNQSGGTLQSAENGPVTIYLGKSWALTKGCYNMCVNSGNLKNTSSNKSTNSFGYHTGINSFADNGTWSTNWKFEYFATPINVTYIFQQNGDTEEITVDLLEGSDAASFIPTMNFCTVNGLTDETTTVSESKKTFHVDATWNLPFVAGHVYRLGVRPSGDFKEKFCGYRNDGKPAARSNADPDNFAAFTTQALWVFERVAGKLNQYKVYNLGADKYINGNGFDTDGYVYTIEPRPSNVGMGNVTEMGFALHGNNTYLSNAAGLIAGYGNCELSHWNGMDAGSIFWVKDIRADINELTTLGDPNSKFLGEAEYTVNASAKTTAAENPTRSNVNALFTCNFADVVNTNKYYRMKCQDTGRSNNYIYSEIHANTSGNVDDASADHRLIISQNEVPVVNTLFQFEKSNNAYYIKHVNSEKYLCSQTSENADVDLPFYKSSAGTYEPTQVKGKWWGIKRTGTNIHIHQSNKQSKKIIIWGALNAEAASNWSIEEVTEIPITISSEVGYSTVCFPVAVAIPNGVNAYIVSSENENSITLTEVTGNVAAKTPLIIKKENGGNISFEIVDNGTEYSSNLLSGTTIKRTGFAENKFWALAADNTPEGVSFKKNGTVTEIPSNKAYLTSEAALNVNAFYFSFDDDVITGVKEFKVVGTEKLYNLQGVSVKNPIKGVYVNTNGKKIIINK